jgi:hypothetical protein
VKPAPWRRDTRPSQHRETHTILDNQRADYLERDRELIVIDLFYRLAAIVFSNARRQRIQQLAQ